MVVRLLHRHAGVYRCIFTLPVSGHACEAGHCALHNTSTRAASLQGRRLIADPVSGLPTCDDGTPALECLRGQWHGKLYEDLLGDESGYNFQVAPISDAKMDPRKYGGYPAGVPACSCTADDPRCKEPGSSGNCLICDTDTPCSTPDATVHMSISFFKITSVDLRSSGLKFSAWMRQIWTDSRLSYDYQCYGGIIDRR